MRQQIVLAMLLLEPGTAVPLTRLIDAMWDGEPPTSARAQVQICVSALRRAVTGAGGPDVIDTRSPGYLIRLEDSTLDSRDFESIVASARRVLGDGDAAGAVTEFRHALSLWRGPALSNIDSMLVQNSVAHFNERRLAVLEECLEAELRAGQVQDLTGELVKLTNEYPLRERFSALLMTALYRAGRQAEALAVFRTARATLIDELGVEPGRDLQRLHQTMLCGDPVPDPVGMTQPVTIAAPQRPVVPRLLPAAIPDFTGRAEIVNTIVSSVLAVSSGDVAGYAVPVNIVFGQGGAGKTTLAVHVAHRLADHFPDGQLFARLNAGNQPADPSDVLGRFLRALGVVGSALPEDCEERAEIYRDLLGQRKILVTLDDARSHQQISPLLPGSSTCSVLVTSRRRLAGLPAANRYEVGALSPRTAVELLSRIVGASRIEAEPHAAETLCRLCGHLPLALRIVAARLASRPHWSVADLVERLADESRRLDELSYGEMGMRASISLSYDSLAPGARRLFRLLALSESPNFAHWAGAPLLQTEPLHAADLLEELAEAYLIDTEQAPGGDQVRYRFHDIARPFAQERLLAEDSPKERREALERLLGALLHLTSEAHCRVYSGNYLLPSTRASRWPLSEALVDRLLDDPLAWYELERSSIVSGVRQAAAVGLTEHSWGLALCAVSMFETHSYFNDWRETHEVALKAACNASDRRGEAAMRYSLGSLYLFEQQNEQAARQLKQSGRLYAGLGDRYGAALVLRNIAILDRRNGSLEQALARSQEALGEFQLVGDRIAEAHVLHNMAAVWLDYGNDATARELLDRAASICLETGNRRVYAQVQRQLGDLSLRLGDLDKCAEAYNAVLRIAAESRDQTGECYALVGLATVDLRHGRAASARQILTGALEMAARMGDRLMESRVALTLAEAELECGGLDAAAENADRALRCFEEMGAALLITQALMSRGKIFRAAGDVAQAKLAWDRAATVLSKMDLRGAVALMEELTSLQLSLAGN